MKLEKIHYEIRQLEKINGLLKTKETKGYGGNDGESHIKKPHY